MKKLPRRALAFLIALLALIVLAFFIGHWFLVGGRFRRHLDSAVGGALRARVVFHPLRFHDETFSSGGFVAVGKPHAFFAELRAGQVRAVVNWRGLLDHRWEIDQLKFENLEVQLTKKPFPKSKVAIRPRKPHRARSQPWRLDLREAEVAHSSWHWGVAPANRGSVVGTAFRLRPNEGGWLLNAHGGTVVQTGFPPLKIDAARLRYGDNTIFLTDGALRSSDDRINLTGKIVFEHAADFQAHFTHLTLAPLLPADWRGRLRGHLAGSAQVHAPLPHGDVRVQADLRLIDGQLDSVPLLDRIAGFTRNKRFRQVPLTRGSVAIARSAGVTTLKNLVIESAGLLRVEGSCQIIRNQLQGDLQLGLAPEILHAIPGAEAHVFTVKHDGYAWAPLRLTGPIAHPHEDLSVRLASAAAAELLKNPKKTLHDLSKALRDLLHP
jgi:hypothetical protein